MAHLNISSPRSAMSLINESSNTLCASFPKLWKCVLNSRMMSPTMASANLYRDTEYIDTLPTMPVIVDKTYHGKYRIFEAEGDSMDDNSRLAICDGDKVLAREVRRDLWLPKLHINDWYFVIIHRTKGISIKQITAQDDKGNITCHSLNELFNDYTVNLDDVVEIYNVIKVVERNMRL